MFKVMANLSQFLIQTTYMFISFKRIKLRYPFNSYFGKPNNILFGDNTIKIRLVRFQAFINSNNNGFPGFTFFNVAVNSVFNKNTLQRGKKKRFHEFLLPDEQFELNQFN